MALYVTGKTWISGEVLFAADLNGEFALVKSAVNSIDQAQLNAGSVGTAQIIAANITKPLLAPSIVDESKVEVDTLIRTATSEDIDDTNVTSISSFPATIATVAITPLKATSRFLVLAKICLVGTVGQRVRVFLEVDRDNDATFEAEVASIGGTAAGSALEPFQSAPAANQAATPYVVWTLDSAAVTPATPVAYRLRVDRIAGAGSMGRRTHSLTAICFNIF
jgi:hypothetical protein